MIAPKALVLVGGGHAHLFVLEAMAGGRLPTPAGALLISLSPRQGYSGMVPALLADALARPELEFDLPRLARAAGAEFLAARVAALDPAAKALTLEDGRTIPYGIVSFAVGSGNAGTEIPGVCQYARLVKPIGKVMELADEVAGAAASGRSSRMVVVGAGAAGCELALALAARGAGSVRLIEAGPGILPGRGRRTRTVMNRALTRHGIALSAGRRVARVTDTAVLLQDGATVPYDILLWATGAAAPSLFRSSGVATDEAGYLLVDDTLRSTSHPSILGAGDAVSLASAPDTPKAGVYAVRQGPVLAANLAAAVMGRLPGRRYRPQRRSLALLETGDGRAIFSWGRWAWWGRGPLWLKRWIDRRFMRRFGG